MSQRVQAWQDLRFRLDMLWARPKLRLARGIILILFALLLLAWLLASLTHGNTSFSIDARSDVVHVELPCGDRLAWDLPAGEMQLAPANEARLASAIVSLSLRGGVHVRLWVDGTHHLNALIASADGYRCPGTDVDRAAVVLDQGEFILADSQWAYRSSAPLAAPSPLLLVLSGRVRIGEQISQGAGLASAGSQPILHRAVVDARTPDPQTAQKRLIHSENIDAGSQIDTHGCLDSRQMDVADCVAASRSDVAGFVRAPHDGESGALQTQAFVAGRSIGVRQFGGIERRVVVTWWSRWVTSSFLQIFAALVLGLSAVAQLTSLFSGESQPRDDRRKMK